MFYVRKVFNKVLSVKRFLVVVVVFAVLGVFSYSSAVFAVAKSDGSYRTLAIQQIGRHIFDSSDTQRLQVKKLLKYIVENTPIPVSGVDGDPSFPSVVDDHPFGTLVRGRGFCDPQAMAFVTLLREIGLRGQVLFLKNQDGISPHTVATVELNNETYVVDPLYGAIPSTTDGEWLTLEEIKLLGESDSLLGYQSSAPRIEQG
jgi:hypothetical protein